MAEGSTVTESVLLSIEELNIAEISVTRNGEDFRHYPLIEGQDEEMLWDGLTPLTLSESGAYVITITDMAGNEFTLTFTISIA